MNKKEKEELIELIRYFYSSEYEEILGTLEEIQAILLDSGIDVPLDIDTFKEKAEWLVFKAEREVEE